ncbi:MAG: dihydrodipicolinate synthase family protein [Planctomycetota bacterium]|nr:MAG: dihydrodipicolinate synthase family protein [Planctomycetota bacterium]
MHLWKNVFPAVTTQFHKDQTLDLDGTARHLEVMLDSGVSGLIVCGSLGENQQLTPEEKRQVVKRTIEVAQGRVPVLSGVAEMSTAAACQYVADCETLGANGFMVMPAMVYKADGAEAMNHFRRVASATSRPWMLYNNPVGYTVDITPAQFAELSNIKNLIAIKESSANTRRITELRIEVGDRYSLFTGVDDLILQSSALGIDGWVAGSGIAFPYENQYFWNLIQAGRYERAREFYKWFYPLLKLDTYIKFVQYIKLAVQEVGLGSEWVREPRLTLAGEERERVLKVIHHGIANRPKLG